MLKKSKGKLVVFEGIDGSGVSTQIDLLADYLKYKKKKVFVTKEPSNSLIGGLIRGHLKGECKTNPQTIQLLFAADRAHHLEKEILPMLKKGYIVLCDRYYLSSLAYGSLVLDKNWLKEINSQFIDPDMTFVLYVPPRVSLQRIKESNFGFELYEDEKKLTKVVRNYFDISRDFKNVVLINASEEKEKVHDEIVRHLEKNMK